MSNLIDDTWSVGDLFTIIFKVVNEGAAGHWFGLMCRDELIHGLEIQKIGCPGYSQSSSAYEDKITRITNIINE